MSDVVGAVPVPPRGEVWLWHERAVVSGERDEQRESLDLTRKRVDGDERVAPTRGRHRTRRRRCHSRASVRCMTQRLPHRRAAPPALTRAGRARIIPVCVLLMRRLGGAFVCCGSSSRSRSSLVSLAPGDAAALLVPPPPRPEDAARLRAELALDRRSRCNMHDGVAALLRGDLGESFYAASTRRSRRSREALPVSLGLGLSRSLLTFVVGVAIGTLQATRRRTGLDRRSPFATTACTPRRATGSRCRSWRCSPTARRCGDCRPRCACRHSAFATRPAWRPVGPRWSTSRGMRCCR